MTDRRQALLGKFRSVSTDRVRGMVQVLRDLSANRAGPAEARELARELHTFKGESRMMGFPAVAEAAHAAEEVLERMTEGDDGSERSALLIQALGIMLLAIRGESGDATALTDVTVRLTALAQQAAPAPVASSRGAAVAQPTVEEARATSPAERWVQLRAARLDEVCERISELGAEVRVLAAQVGQIARQAPVVPGSRARAVRESALRNLLEAFEQCRAHAEEAAEAAWSMRLTSVEPMLNELEQHTRDLAVSLGKRARVVVRGASAELERSVIDALWEPMLHLVRNAVDHGLEVPGERGGKPDEATIELGATPGGASVVLSVADDGRGIDLEAVRRAAVRRGVLTAEQAAAAVEGELLDLLFSHGFSTRERAGELSGRGVGLDAMRGAVEALGGFVTLSTELGEGTRFSLTVPTSISKEAAVITEVAGSLWAVPSRYVLEVVRIADQALAPAPRGDGLVFPFRGEDVPLVSLAELLAPGGASMHRVDRVAAVVDAGVGRVALGLPLLVGERELVRRAVDPVVAAVGYLAGSATLDDGRLVLILLLPGLLRMAAAIAERGIPASSSAAPRVPVAARTRVLVVDDSPIVCELVAELLEAAGLAPRTALGGRAALQLLGTQSFDVVLTDLDMPGMDGLELLERVRSGWPALPVVVLSARERPSELARATDLGAAAFLAKSEFHTATLVQTLRKVAKSG